MAYASQSGRARTQPRNPRAFAVCQRCGFWYNRDQLQFQHDYRGAQLLNLYILVCKPCYDEPQEQLRAITLPADPVPIFYPSVEDFVGDSTDYRSVSYPPVTDPITGIPVPSTVLRTTQDCNNRTLEPYGNPADIDANAIMPLQIVNGVPTHFDIVLPVLSVTSTGTIVQVTCSAVHNLQPNAQIVVNGLTNGNGFFSVAILTATAFTYTTTQAVAPALTPHTRIVTCKVGLPYGYTDVPEPYGVLTGGTQGGGGPSPPATVPGPPLDVEAS
jgi:hypothetical protein